MFGAGAGRSPSHSLHLAGLTGARRSQDETLTHSGGVDGCPFGVFCCVAQAQKPLGFERFTVADVATGVDFGLTELEVFEKYAARCCSSGAAIVPSTGKRTSG